MAEEPFGEVRMDLRFASLMHLYYSAKRGKGGKKLLPGEFALYPDIVDLARDARNEQNLIEIVESVRKKEPRNGN